MKNRNTFTYALCEVVADFGLFFATASHLPGNSRETVRLIIEWALDFEFKTQGVEWGIVDRDYLSESESYFNMRYDEWKRTDNDHYSNHEMRQGHPHHRTRVGDKVRRCFNAVAARRRTIKACLGGVCTVIAVYPGYLLVRSDTGAASGSMHTARSWVKVRK